MVDGKTRRGMAFSSRGGFPTPKESNTERLSLRWFHSGGIDPQPFGKQIFSVLVLVLVLKNNLVLVLILVLLQDFTSIPAGGTSARAQSPFNLTISQLANRMEP